jgi:hypothetical protein
MEMISFQGEGSIVAGVAGKSVTVRRLALAAHAPLKMTVLGTSLARGESCAPFRQSTRGVGGYVRTPGVETNKPC